MLTDDVTLYMWTTCYDDVRKIGDTQYLTYRDACFAMGFHKDDRVYITAIKEAKDSGLGTLSKEIVCPHVQCHVISEHDT
ncbi:unnamed protein product [Trifolium pratense]|uniref:Uncharacterized protein n=1 Tax=Trifolium pratense TaxID=57577 RepID=A0ACB0KYA8_TRIPR|nr:unnamed protein product [Trifolium pratense]